MYFLIGVLAYSVLALIVGYVMLAIKVDGADTPPVVAVVTGIVWPLTMVAGIVVGFLVGMNYFLMWFWKRADEVVFRVTQKEVDRSDYGILYRGRASEGERKVLVVSDTTGTYRLIVDPQMNTAHEAVAWTFQLSDKTYKPEAQS